MPFKIHEDTNPYDNPVRDIRDQGVVVTTLFRNPAKKNNQTKQEPNGSRNNNSTNSDPSKDQIETRTTTAATVLTSTASQNFPKPTVSPTKDPYYIYREAAQIVGKRNPNAGISSEYLLRDNVAATEKPKMKNAFDEGRYEFKPSRFRQTEPILLSGSSLFGNGEPTKSARQAGGSGYPQPVNLENILIRSKNVSGDENPASLGQFSNPTTYEEYIKNLERISGVPVLGNPANPNQGVQPSGNAFNLRPPGPGRPSAHFSEGYSAPPFPYQLPPSQASPPASPPDGSSSTSTSTSGKALF